MSKNTRYRDRQEQRNRARGKLTPTLRAETRSVLLSIAEATAAQHRREMAGAHSLTEAGPHLNAIEQLTGGSGMSVSALLAEQDYHETGVVSLQMLEEELGAEF